MDLSYSVGNLLHQPPSQWMFDHRDHPVGDDVINDLLDARQQEPGSIV